MDDKDTMRVRCCHCGHRQVIPVNLNVSCSACGRGIRKEADWLDRCGGPFAYVRRMD